MSWPITTPSPHKAQKISDKLPEEKRAAFYELVLFPTKASAQLNAMYLAAAKNSLVCRARPRQRK